MPDSANVDSARQRDPRSAAARSNFPRRATTPVRNITIAALAAAASASLFELSAADPRLWPCALLAPLPILATAVELPTRRAAQFAFVAYFVGNLAGWGGESFAVPLITLFASHIAGAVVFATFVACAVEATRRWSGVLAALVFPTFEAAFYFTLAGESPHGTWGNPAYSQVDLLPMLQVSSWLGMSGVTFIMSLLPSGLAVAWYRRRWNMEWEDPAVIAVGVFAIAFLIGSIRVLFAPTTPSVRVAMIASDRLIPQSESGDMTDAADIVALYAKLVRKVADGRIQVVVLPEKIVGVSPRYEWDVVQGFSRIASMSHVWLVVGLNQIDRSPKRNIAVVFDPDGKIVVAYAKHHLIPSLEWDYKPGSKPAIFDAPWGRTAVLISQDLDFIATARELAAQQVRVVLAPASDWRGSEKIHQRMAVLRGVEAGFSIARAARNGMVSANDSRGHQIAALATSPIQDAIATADLPLGPGQTFYSRHGDWFGQLSVIFTILLMLRLGVSIGYAANQRRLGRATRVTPSGVISVEVGNQSKVEQQEPENETYHPPTRPPTD
jgi:apolipoprotein N-acyltransferase